MIQLIHKLSIVFLTIMCLAIPVTSGQTQLDFDCRRMGVDCSTDECDVSSGKCLCKNQTVSNYRCQDAAANQCGPSMYGENCVLNRIQVDCTAGKMFVNIYPDGNFTGIIYVHNKPGVVACQLKDQATKPSYVKNSALLKGRGLELDYVSADCGDADKQVDPKNPSKTTYVRNYIVQYNTNFLSGLDHKIGVSCIVGMAKVTGQVNDVKEVTGNFKNVDVNSNADPGAVTFSIQSKDNSDLPAQVDLGQEIKLVFTLNPGKGYVDFSLASCYANNTLTNETSHDFRSIMFVENNCPSDQGQALFQNGISKENGATANDASTMTVSISAFMFSGTSNKVGFLCDVKLCRDDNVDECKKPECQGITSDVDKKASQELATTPAVTEDSNSPTSTVDQNDASVDNTTEANQNNTVDDVTGNQNNTPVSSNQTDNQNSQSNSSQGSNSTDVSTTSTPKSTAGNETPAATTIPPANAGARRRRAAEEDPMRQVYNEMTVRDPTAIIENPVEPLTEKDCMEEPEIVAVVAILSVLVITLFLLTVVILCHFIRSGPKKESNQDIQPDIRPIQTFNIPRLEITAKRPNSYATA